MKGYEVYRKEKKENDNVFGFAVVKNMNKVVAEMELIIDDGVAAVQSIFVREDERRKGVGTLLLQSVVNVLDESDLMTPLEIRFPLEKETEGFYEFMKVQGNFDLEEEECVYHIKKSQRKALKKWKQMSLTDTDAVELFGLDESIVNKFMDELRKKGYDDYIDTDLSQYDPRLCFARVKDDKVLGAIFVRARGEEDLEAEFLYTGDNNPKTVQSILCAAINAADELYTKADIRFTTISPEGAGVAKGIFGSEIKPGVMVRASWDGISARALADMRRLIEEDIELD